MFQRSKHPSLGDFATKNVAFKLDQVKEDGRFSGYGSVFGNVDSYDEVVAPGAFAKSLAVLEEIGDPLPALWQHRSDQPIGGYDLLAEDDHGLKCAGFLLIGEIVQAREAHALMKRRIVKGLSIGYYVRGASFDQKTGILTLTELELREISPVTFAANELARVEDVKQLIEGGRLPTLSQFEDLLREAGFSKTQAVAVANHGLGYLRRSESGGKSDVLSALQTFSSDLDNYLTT